MLYRSFFREAWRLMWERKNLWIFGIFAALISTGGVVDVVWRSLERIEDAESLLTNLADSSFIGYKVASSYISQIGILGPSRVSFILIALTLMVVLLVVMATISQAALIHGIRNKEKTDPYELHRYSSKHFWSLFTLALITKISMIILIVLMTLPLWLVSISSSNLHIALFFVLMILFIPAVMIVNIVYMFALIDCVESNEQVINAIHTGIKIFSKQWLASLEYGILLFFLVFGTGLIFIGILACLLVPYAIFYTSTLLTGSFLFFISFNIVALFILIGLILTFGGACVTFQYSSWYQFYKLASHNIHGKKHFSKILRFAHR